MKISQILPTFSLKIHQKLIIFWSQWYHNGKDIEITKAAHQFEGILPKYDIFCTKNGWFQIFVTIFRIPLSSDKI